MDAGMMNLVFLAVFMGIFYLFFMRPSIKKQKAQDEFSKGLTKGDQVVTGSGILGKVTKVEENGIVELQIDNKSFIRVIRSAISKENTDAVYNTKEGK
jgi:preprotein translocase subunit YajC